MSDDYLVIQCYEQEKRRRDALTRNSSRINMSQSSIYEFFKSVRPKADGIIERGKKCTTERNSRKQTGKISPLKSQPTVQTPENFLDGFGEAEFMSDTSSQNQLPHTRIKKSNPNSNPGSDVENRKRTSSQRNQGTPSPRKRLQKSPATAAVRRMRSRGPRSTFCSEDVDTGKVSDMIDNLNLARMGILPRGNFNLEEIYSANETTDSLDMENIFRDTNNVSTVYDAGGVVVPRDEQAQHFFKVITEVFSNPDNCRYFNNEELDQVFTFLTLSEKAQMLFVRMIKRKHQWHRSRSILYPHIDADLKPHFDELETKGFYTSDTSNEHLKTLLEILKAEEVREICQRFKLPCKNKAEGLERILKNNLTKSLFPGVESPNEKAKKIVKKKLGHCVCLRKDIISLVDRIVTLFTPWEEISATLSDIFLKLTEVKNGSMRYPETPVKRYPRFRDRDHLVRYVEWRNKWRQIDGLVKTNPENWETLKSIGREAYSRFAYLLRQNSDREAAAIPRHVINYSEEYVCAKLVTICLEVFKREESLIPEAIDMLENLIEQRSYLQSKKGAWYEELALIETKHRNNLEAAAAATIAGLTLDNLTENVRIVLSKRAKGLIKRRSGLTSDTKSRLVNLIEEQPKTKPHKVVSIVANVMNGNRTGKKSTWYMDLGDGDVAFTNVEGMAMHHYKELGYVQSWHCEGSLPVTLFTLLMWEEVYSVPVPAAYLSPYQKAPLDLYTSEFYANRKEFIDKKIERIETTSAEELANAVEASFEKWKNYESLMPNSLPIGGENLKDLVKCMGTALVAGICRRMATNFVGHRAGFPDLVVWNAKETKCKIVEVKGPGDSLSAKQTLWLGYLDELGADTELCEVKSVTKSQRKKRDTDD